MRAALAASLAIAALAAVLDRRDGRRRERRPAGPPGRPHGPDEAADRRRPRVHERPAGGVDLRVRDRDRRRGVRRRAVDQVGRDVRLQEQGVRRRRGRVAGQRPDLQRRDDARDQRATACRRRASRPASSRSRRPTTPTPTTATRTRSPRRRSPTRCRPSPRRRRPRRASGGRSGSRRTASRSSTGWTPARATRSRTRSRTAAPAIPRPPASTTTTRCRPASTRARSKKKHSKLVGWILDGFPIFGYRGKKGELLTNADLDVCHGHTHKVKIDGKHAARLPLPRDPRVPLHGRVLQRDAVSSGAPGGPPA